MITLSGGDGGSESRGHKRMKTKIKNLRQNAPQTVTVAGPLRVERR